MIKYLVLIVVFCILLIGCSYYKPITAGMTTNSIIKERGQPDYKKIVLDYEIWLYKIREPDLKHDGLNDACLIKSDKVVISRSLSYGLQGLKDLLDGWVLHTSEADLRKDLDCIHAGKIRRGMNSTAVLLSLGQPKEIGNWHSVGFSFLYVDKNVDFDEAGKVDNVSDSSILIH
ncbi:MAG: hypothetical protein HZA49_07370 [Planctomycetes bacterium]|nr:hypothetical protein [Planctomycetota bacterium]